jgi:diguanylate cyclase (GGDEF)-like protein
VHKDYPEQFAAEMGRSPFEVAMAWEKSLENSDCLLLDDLGVIKERDPVWYESLRKHDIRNIILYAVRNNKMLVGFIWVANYDTSKRMQIKETLELTTFLISAVIANHQFVSQLEFKSTTDGLTQLFNRNAMNDRVDQLVSGENALPNTMGVVLADLNGLKTVNDDEGHDAGDKLLIRASALLKLAFGDYEIYRAGGDEFFIFCPDITEDKLNEQAGRLNSLANNTPDVRFAVGSVYLKGEYDIRNAMKTADERMYKDKQEYYRQHPEKDKRKQNRS